MKKKSSLFMHIASNLVLVFLLFSISIVCFYPTENQVTAGEGKSEVYRNAPNGEGVSLMFNVYGGTNEVYQILDILDVYEAKSTFFIGGCWADDNVECLKAILDRGHELGNHGYFHKDHSVFNKRQNIEEIDRCNEFIYLATNFKPTLFAPPSGAFNDECLSAADHLGMKTILWSKDTIDWRDQNENLIFKRATKNVEKGDFVLMHPTKATVRALDNILKFYQDSHLQAITVTENLQLGG